MRRKGRLSMDNDTIRTTENNGKKGILKPKSDIVFKKLFTENLDLLHDFLAHALGLSHDEIGNIEVKNSEILPLWVDGKLNRMDIKTTVGGRNVNIEMQAAWEGDFRDRSLYMWSRLYVGDLDRGDEYAELVDSITINILGYNLFDHPAYHSNFTMMERERKEILTDKCAIHFLELMKTRENTNTDDGLMQWLRLIDAETKEELDMLDQVGTEPIKKAVYTVYQMSADEKMRYLEEQDFIATLDYNSQIGAARRSGLAKGRVEGRAEGKVEGRAEGKVEGRAEGRAEEKIALAQKLLIRGRPMDEIVEDTGLSLADVEALR